MPSLHAYGDNQIVFITKSEQDPTLIVALIFVKDQVGRNPIATFAIGSNESQYPTDCVFKAIDDTIVIALNKRTKSSEPFATELI